MRLNKIIVLVLLTLGMIISIDPVKAETYSGSLDQAEYVPNVYIKKIRSNGTGQYRHASVIRRSTDRQFIYCLQPFVDVDNNNTYNVTKSDYTQILGLTDEQWDKISLIAYYGYDYGSHTELKWYTITQILIWRIVDPSGQFYFTDTLNGNRNDSLFSSEIAEIEDLVSKHYIMPRFNKNNFILPIGQSIALSDQNGVLSNYRITSTENVIASIQENSLNITATSVGNGKINLLKSDFKYKLPPMVYFSPYSQNAMSVGYFDPVPAKVELTIIGGQVEIYKKDSKTKSSVPRGIASLKGAVYGIYNLNDERIGELITDQNGYAISNYLPSLGEYYLKEEKASLGYTIDKNKYKFLISAENPKVTIDVFEQIINVDYDITKVYTSGITEIMTVEPNVEFEFYDSKGNLYKKVATDENGKMKINLIYDTYTVKQITTTPGYEKIDDFTIEVKESSPTVYKIISNKEIIAKLKVIKIDSESKTPVKRSGIKFKIRNLETNEYVCQDVTYPTVSKICEYQTDQNGEFVTPKPLSMGKYVLEEIDQVIDGYTWNKISKEFEITKDSEFSGDSSSGIIFETTFSNSPVKGKINIKKIGEKLIIENGSYEYIEIPLKKVQYELHAAANIYDGTGILMHKKDSLIRKIETEDNGTATIENLYLGKYYLIETKSSEGNLVDNQKRYFELSYKDQYTDIIELNFTFTNRLPKGTLDFTKTDIAGNPLPNTTITIYTNNDNEERKLIFKGKTDESGRIVINGLFISKFVLFESEAPEGYILNEEPIEFEIKNGGEIIKATMQNEKIVDVPDTDTTDYHILEITSALCVLSGIGVVIFEKKRK